MKTTTLAILAAIAATASLPAQIEQDPRKRIQEIMDQVADEMTQIDKWLQNSSRSRGAAEAMQKNVQRLDKLLDDVGKSQKRVVKGIDDLLKEAQKLKGKGGGC